MAEYYNITKWKKGLPYYNNVRLWEITTIKSFKKYTLFDAEEMYQKGVLNKDNVNDVFRMIIIYLLDLFNFLLYNISVINNIKRNLKIKKEIIYVKILFM